MNVNRMRKHTAIIILISLAVCILVYIVYKLLIMEGTTEETRKYVEAIMKPDGVKNTSLVKASTAKVAEKPPSPGDSNQISMAEISNINETLSQDNLSPANSRNPVPDPESGLPHTFTGATDEESVSVPQTRVKNKNDKAYTFLSAQELSAAGVPYIKSERSYISAVMLILHQSKSLERY